MMLALPTISEGKALAPAFDTNLFDKRKERERELISLDLAGKPRRSRRRTRKKMSASSKKVNVLEANILLLDDVEDKEKLVIVAKNVTAAANNPQLQEKWLAHLKQAFQRQGYEGWDKYNADKARADCDAYDEKLLLDLSKKDEDDDFPVDSDESSSVGSDTPRLDGVDNKEGSVANLPGAGAVSRTIPDAPRENQQPAV